MITIPQISQNREVKRSQSDTLRKAAFKGPFDYVKESSKLENLYDLIDIKNQKIISDGKQIIVLAQESDTNSHFPIFRFFQVDKNGRPELTGSVMDTFHNDFEVYDKSGKCIGGKGSFRDSAAKMLYVNDSAMTAQVQDMTTESGKLPEIDTTLGRTQIKAFNPDGSFNSMHKTVYNNIVSYVRELLSGGGDVSEDVIKNADKYMTFDDITSKELNDAKLLKKDKLFIKDGSLEINTGLLQGKVPLFEQLKTSAAEGDEALFRIEPGSFLRRQKANLFLSSGEGSIVKDQCVGNNALGELEHIFIKAASKYLTELNHLIHTNDINCLDVLQKMLKR